MTAYEILTGARAKIANRENWCQEDMAQDNLELSVDPRSEDACAWCLVGAMHAVTPRDVQSHAELRTAFEILGALLGWDECNANARVYGPWDYASEYNDGHEHGEVLDLLDTAIIQ